MLTQVHTPPLKRGYDDAVGGGCFFVARVMLQKLSNEIRECYRHAAEARHKAEVTTHLPTKAEFQDIERRWLSLARSYEFSEQLASFTHEVKRNMRKR
jgi:hypothetical protein